MTWYKEPINGHILESHNNNHRLYCTKCGSPSPEDKTTADEAIKLVDNPRSSIEGIMLPRLQVGFYYVVFIPGLILALLFTGA